MRKCLRMSENCCTFAAAKVKTTKLTCMEAVRQTSYDLAKRLGKHYGLNDIHEAYLIDPNWREQPMRAWDDVYEDLCREVGSAYGLNDIREA